jgi:hypothetical protein
MPPTKPFTAPRSARVILSSFLGLFFTLTVTAAHGQYASDITTNSVYARRAEAAYQATALNYAAAPDIATNCWQLGRTAFDWCQFATNDTQRAEIAKTGIAACQRLTAADPKSAVGHYYLAMNYGELAQAEAPSLAAYRLIKDIEREFQVSRKLDEHLDYAGPDRNLGLLYRNAPGWPLSIGNNRKALEHLQHAAKIAPGYPENQLNLGETQVTWHMADDASATIAKLNAIWPAAQTNFTGQAWDESWDDWTARRAALRAEYTNVFDREP